MAKAKGIYKRGNVWWLRYAGPDGLTRYESAKTASFRDAQAMLIDRKKGGAGRQGSDAGEKDKILYLRRVAGPL